MKSRKSAPWRAMFGGALGLAPFHSPTRIGWPSASRGVTTCGGLAVWVLAVAATPMINTVDTPRVLARMPSSSLQFQADGELGRPGPSRPLDRDSAWADHCRGDRCA